MREGTAAVFEALSWVQEMLSELQNDPKGIEKAVNEVRDAIEDMKKGIAIDFRHRLRGL
ncbi:MAG: hypothetical protein OEZ48_08335 [Candidatus Bathyarchaeota archaeon]|nr:hypothetical protein [Candidatus Bathyarchaeota archaeon]MDH5687853.1 hypothetical protein [Candidatus Bathyarchaeota archaeon]